MTATSALAAIRAAKQLAATACTNGTGLLDPRRAKALETIAHAQTAERFRKGEYNPTADRWEGFDTRGLVRDLTSWAGDHGGVPRATKPVVRSVIGALTGTCGYPYGAELAGYASAIAGLVDPDRLGRIVDECANLAASEPQPAYAPMRHANQTPSRLAALLDKYQPAARERLLVSLWATAHHGCWWTELDDHQDPGHLRRAARHDKKREALEPLLDEARAGNRSAIVEVLERHVEFGRVEVNLWTELAPHLPMFQTMTSAERSAIRLALKSPVRDPYAGVTFAHLGGLFPLERPESPIPAMVSALYEACETALESGELAADGIFTINQLLPPKAVTWADLWPEGLGIGRFPIPSYLARAFHKKILPGSGELGPNPEARVTVIFTEAKLKENGDYMGNCTWSIWRTQAMAGQRVMGKVTVGDTCYNYALDRTHTDGWTFGEINSRHNAGNVPMWITDGLKTMLRGLEQPPPAA